MILKTVRKKVVDYSTIPQDIVPEWLRMNQQEAYVEVHFDDESFSDPLDFWLVANYPELKDLDDSFFINMGT